VKEETNGEGEDVEVFERTKLAALWFRYREGERERERESRDGLRLEVGRDGGWEGGRERERVGGKEAKGPTERTTERQEGRQRGRQREGQKERHTERPRDRRKAGQRKDRGKASRRDIGETAEGDTETKTDCPLLTISSLSLSSLQVQSLCGVG